MPRIDCGPDQVFPEQLEARLLIPGDFPDDPPQLLAIVPLTWDWLGWGRYAFAIPSGNSHVHMNLTCAGPAPDKFGLHFSLYGRDYTTDFLKPVRTTADPLQWEFAIDVPGPSLAKLEPTVPLQIVITAATGQTVNLEEPFPWPLYGMVSGWSSDSSFSSSDNWDFSGSFGVGWEGGVIDFLLQATSFIGEITVYQVDINRDGSFDFSANHDPLIGGALVLDQPQSLLGSTVDNGTYWARMRVTTSTGSIVETDIPILIGNVPPAIDLTTPASTNPGEVFTLGIATADPGPDTVTSLSIAWGDGFSESHAVGSGSFPHVYAQADDYTITVTVTDEDCSNAIDWIVDIGDTNNPSVPSTLPYITSATASIDPSSLQATLTVSAVDQYGNPVTDFTWDINQDDIFGDATGTTVVLSRGTEYWPYQAVVRFTDANGFSDEAILAFADNGPVEAEPTLGSYESRFRKATPNMPPANPPEGEGWRVHHTKQQVLATRYQDELGINVHKNIHLRGVPKRIHDLITAEQKAWWEMKARELSTPDIPVDSMQAKQRVPLAEVELFEAELDTKYSKYWISAGANKKTVNKVINFAKQDYSKLLGNSGARLRSLGMIFAGIELFDLFAKHAKAANNIASHTPEQLVLFDVLIGQYGLAIEQANEAGRLKQGQAVFLKDAFINYWCALGIDGETLQRADLAMEAYILTLEQ